MADIIDAQYLKTIKEIESAQFEIVDFKRFNEKSSIWNFIPHSHDFFELIFFLHGNAQVSINERSVYATFSDALLYPPRTKHTEHLQINHRQEIYCLQVYCEGVSFSEPVHIQDRQQQIRLLLDGLFAEYCGGYPDQEVVNCYLKTLAVMLARGYYLGNTPTHPVDYCMMFMRNNLAENITIQQLSSLIHVSRPYLNKLFVQHTGVTPMQYMTEIRMDAAKSLLMTTSRRVSDIANDVGFQSPKYFCATFHRATGMSPREYRKAEGLNAFANAEEDNHKPSIGNYIEPFV